MYIINNSSGFIFNASNADVIYADRNKVEAVSGCNADGEHIKYIIAECNTLGEALGILSEIRRAIISGNRYFEID